jgi:hypothetical protein
MFSVINFYKLYEPLIDVDTTPNLPLDSQEFIFILRALAKIRLPQKNLI